MRLFAAIFTLLVGLALAFFLVRDDQPLSAIAIMSASGGIGGFLAVLEFRFRRSRFRREMAEVKAMPFAIPRPPPLPTMVVNPRKITEWEERESEPSVRVQRCAIMLPPPIPKESPGGFKAEANGESDKEPEPAKQPHQKLRLVHSDGRRMSSGEIRRPVRRRH